jgi:hypothetical protein
VLDFMHDTLCNGRQFSLFAIFEGRAPIAKNVLKIGRDATDSSDGAGERDKETVAPGIGKFTEA